MKKQYKYAICAVACAWAAITIVALPQLIEANREEKNFLKAFDRYSSALVSHNFPEAYKYCGTEFQDAMTLEQFVSFQESFETKFGHLRAVKRTAYHIRGENGSWKANISADLSYEKKTATFYFVFCKEYGQWVVFGAEER